MRPDRDIPVTLVFALLGALLLPSCSRPEDTSRVVPEDHAVKVSRTELIGLNQTDIRMCAGFPSATVDVGAQGTIWTYTKTTTRGGVSVSLPSVEAGPLEGTAGSVSLAGGANCSMQVRFINGKVVQVAFSGDNNGRTLLDKYCAPVVDSCDRYAENGWSTEPHAPTDKAPTGKAG
ncbi:hypothetical protein [Acidimangrovimonas sediminis]|uniref:hypothetical protein n=1 Tax=Acidimangrovimonas sediminis TaxID=2056283 RepID=UPI0011AF8837|nr:hypothetical protein [Acidimangrovimonas sediminis]